MPLDSVLLVSTIALGVLVLLVAAVVREVAADGYGTRPAPRSHEGDGFEPVEPPRGTGLPGRATTVRFGRLVAGLALYGGAIALMVRAAIGLGPWDVLAQGVSRSTGLPFGIVTNLIGAAVLVLWWPLRQRPGAGTILNVLLVGTSAQVVLGLIGPIGPPAVRIPLFAVGMVLLALATAIYLGPGLGAGPRDGLMVGLHRRLGLPIWLARTVVEGSVLVAGWLLGGDVGPGTIAFAGGIGPLCALAIRVLSNRTATGG